MRSLPLLLVLLLAPLGAAHYMPMWMPPPCCAYPVLYDWGWEDVPSTRTIERALERTGPENVCHVSVRSAAEMRWEYVTRRVVAEADDEEFLVLLARTDESRYRLSRNVGFVRDRCRLPAEDGWAILIIDVPRR